MSASELRSEVNCIDTSSEVIHIVTHTHTHTHVTPINTTPSTPTHRDSKRVIAKHYIAVSLNFCFSVHY